MKKSSLLALAILSSNFAFAEKGEHREHDAHEHGHAQLSVIVENNELLVMLETPAMNVFGFEHKPENDKQIQIVNTAVKDLKNIEPLIAINSKANCSVVKTNVKHPFEMSDDDHEDDKEAHDDHKDEHKEESAHTDVDIEISYTCKDASKLENMDLSAFFKRFPLFEELEAQGIVNGQQSATEISAKQPVFSLKK